MTEQITEEIKAPEAAPAPTMARTFELPKKECVAIVGCADSKNQTPFHLAHEWEFWGVNNLHLTLKGVPWSRWFETHQITMLPTGQYLRRGKPDFRGQPINLYLQSLQALNIPIYMQQPLALVPNAVQYPLDNVLKEFPRKYFTNTISYMIALALMHGFKKIGIYGVDMAVSSPLRGQNEYSHQRPSCEYFVGMAEGRGVEVIIPDESDLLKTNFLYSFEEHKEESFISKCRELTNSMAHRRAEAEKQRALAEQKIQQYIGAESCANEIMKIRTNLSNDPTTWKYGSLADVARN
jgi:hypothetical protein